MFSTFGSIQSLIISIEKERMYVVVRLVSLFDDVGKVGKG